MSQNSTDKNLDDLEKENKNLKERLRVLEKSRNPLSPLPRPPLSSIRPPVPSQTENSFSSVQEEDVHNVLFYLKTILGYTVEQDGSVITLRSVYSFCNEDVFVIEIKNNKLVFKNTEYLTEFEELFNVYVRNRQSYSAFFAAVTLELFNRKTFG